MESTTPEPQRPICIPTFAQVQATFRNDPTITTYSCLMHNARVGPCAPLQTSQVQSASTILCNDLPKTLRDVWNVISCLVCVQHQGGRTYTHKHRVKYHWQDEFPDLDLSQSPMPRSRYSLSSSPRTVRLSTPSRRARAQTPSHGQANEEPTTPTPDIHIPRAQDLVDDDADMDEDPFITTPDSTRPSSPIGSQEPDHLDSAAGETDSATNPNPQPSTPPPTNQRTFAAGASSTWPLWRVRQEVRHLLYEPLPNPKACGVLYAISSPQYNRVKIGYTMRRDPHDRFRELERQHGGPLGNPWYLEGIPYVQLLRLEQLIHADLARYQCDLRVPFGRGNGVRVHKEWFDIDLHTAETTAKFWWAAMQHLRIKPGSELSDGVRDRLTTKGDLFEVKHRNVNGPFGDCKDHETTIELWSQLLQVPRPGTKTWRDRWPWVLLALVSWLCGAGWLSSCLASTVGSLLGVGI